jgi:hypothetical protein
VLASVANAVWSRRQPDFAADHSWDGSTYNVQDGSGALGTMTFLDGDRLVGAFFTPLAPAATPASGAAWEALVGPVPAGLRAVLESETTQFLLQEAGGSLRPTLTTTLWSDAGALTTPVDWAVAVEAGLHLIEPHLLAPDDALAHWQWNFELQEAETATTSWLFGLAPGPGTAPVEVPRREVETRLGGDPGDIEALTTRLAQVGLRLT